MSRETNGAEPMHVIYHLPFRHVERFGLGHYRNVVVLNAVDAETVRSSGIRTRAWVIPNAVEPPLEPVEADGAGGYLLYLGRIDVAQKGIDLLLHALARSGCTLPLKIAGRGTPAQERCLAQLLHDVGCRVETVGHVTGVAKARLLRHAAAVIIPSRFETFGLSALEAMSYGRPVVCFDLPRLAWTQDAGGWPWPRSTAGRR